MSKRAEREKRKMKYGSARTRAETHDTGFASTTIKLPEGMSWYSIKKEGIYRFDIIPYIVGKGNPCSEKGFIWYERTFFAHRWIGPAQKNYICPAKTFGKPCPICQEQARLRRDPNADPKAIKALGWSERQLFLVQPINEKGRKEGDIQLWDMSHFCFGKLLDARVKRSDEDDNFENFFYLDKGKYLKCTSEDTSMGAGKPFQKVISIDFMPRKEPYDESILDEMPCLDDLIIETPYKVMKAALEATEEDEEGDDDDEPKKKKKKVRAKDDDDENDESEEDDEEADSEDNDEDEEDSDEEEEDSEEDSDEDDSDDEEDDDEDDSSDSEEDEDSGDDDEDVDDDDSDGDDDEAVIAVGDVVEYKEKGKTLKGKVRKINPKNGIALIKLIGEKFEGAKPRAVPIKILKETEESDEDEEDKKPAKKKKKVVDEDDDIPFDDDDDDEDNKPKKKKSSISY